MRSTMKCTVSAPDVKGVAREWIQTHLRFEDYKRKCTGLTILWVLLFAASRLRSISDACQRLEAVPAEATLRKALLATLPPQKDLEARLNAALDDRLPKPFLKRGQRIAIDFTMIPNHGQPCHEERKIRRGQPKHGTTHFHAYATAYVVQKGQRYTLAMTYVFGDENVKQVVQRLMQQVRELGVKVRFLLVDKEFFQVDVIRYLQAARYPFLMPAFARGRKPQVPRTGSLHEFASRKRFGIETTYRQMNECRIRTSTRKPLLRLLFVGLALILRNVWVWCHLNWLAQRRGRGIWIRHELLRLREMMLWLQHLIETEFGSITFRAIPTDAAARNSPAPKSPP